MNLILWWRMGVAPLVLALAPLRNRELARLLRLGLHFLVAEWPVLGTLCLLFVVQLGMNTRYGKKGLGTSETGEQMAFLTQLLIVPPLFAWPDAPRLLFYTALLPTVLDLARETASMLAARPQIPETEDPPAVAPTLGVFV